MSVDAEAVPMVLVMIDELVIQLERIEEALAETAGRLARLPRETLEAMRDVQTPVTPEALLLARLHRAAAAVARGRHELQSIGADTWQALEQVFAQGGFPLGLLCFEDLVRGAQDPPPEVDMSAVYEILSRRYDTGETDVAARHNELEP
jgi:hypothetical protein